MEKQHLTEGLLYEAGKRAVTDPSVSFDGNRFFSVSALLLKMWPHEILTTHLGTTTLLDISINHTFSVGNYNQDTDNRRDAYINNNGTVSFYNPNLFRARFGTTDQDADFDGSGSVSFPTSTSSTVCSITPPELSGISNASLTQP